ncbi:hypothetical protein SLNSH_06695 [Alsobacter soli]|uniref:Rap1a immunity protein domain-containing protein n=2 Tax=Alsobacter soli TaxID=2109933 RepID=A0A2T1HVH2_9HYPH|nr:hypothetical protein SLNSH_06695 [Alsobacter soli]
MTLVASQYPARADQTDGNAQLAVCRLILGESSLRPYDQGFCIGAVHAIRYSRGRLHICIPDGVTNMQAVRVLVNYMESHPARLNLDITDLAMNAFKKAWPCK